MDSHIASTSRCTWIGPQTSGDAASGAAGTPAMSLSTARRPGPSPAASSPVGTPDGRNTDRLQPAVTIVVDGDLLLVLAAVDFDGNWRSTDRREQEVTPLHPRRIRSGASRSVVGLQRPSRLDEAAKRELRHKPADRAR